MTRRLITPSSSAKNIKIKRKAPLTPVQRYRALLASCGSNKNDQAIAFIIACIGDGLNTRSQIVAMGGHCGLNWRHLAIMLEKEKEGDHTLPRWRHDDRGVYELVN